MTFGRKAILGVAFALIAATAAALATGALGSRSAATPPDLVRTSTKPAGFATLPLSKKPKCKMRACAWVNKDGTLIAGVNVVGATRVSDPGVYCVELKSSIRAPEVAFVLLSVDYFNTATATNVTAQWYSADPGFFYCNGNNITVKTYANEGGTSATVNAAFVIGVP